MKTKRQQTSKLAKNKTNFSRSEYAKMNMKRANHLFKKQVFATFPECLSYSHKIQKNIDTIETIYKLYSNRLKYFITNKVYNKDTFIISDLLSTTWEKVMKSYYTFNPLKGNILTWLHDIAISVIIDNARSNKKYANTLNVSDFVDENGHEFIQIESTDFKTDIFEANEKNKAVHKAINSLPIAYRQTMIYRFLDELSINEIAEIMQIPESTVKGRILRGKELLESSLRAVYENN